MSQEEEDEQLLRELLVRNKQKRDLLISQILEEETDSDQEFQQLVQLIFKKTRQPSRAIQSLCPVCIQPLPPFRAQSRCGHSFCYGCIRSWLQKKRSCPLCRDKTDELKIFGAVKPPSRKKQCKSLSQQMAHKFHKNWKAGNPRVQYIPMGREDQIQDLECYLCGSGARQQALLICDGCESRACHFDCCGLPGIPVDSWLCTLCQSDQ